MNDKNAELKFRYLKLQKKGKWGKKYRKCIGVVFVAIMFIAIVKSCQSLSSFFSVLVKKTRHIQPRRRGFN
jgi:hypothetical protein